MISLPIELYSSKNSKQIFKTKDGRYFIAKSSAAMKNEKTLLKVLTLYRKQWQAMTKGKEYPLRVGYFIYRRTHGRWDWINLIQGISDVMQKAGWLPDDDVTHYTPVFLGYAVDKNNPRVEIEVL